MAMEIDRTNRPVDLPAMVKVNVETRGVKLIAGLNANGNMIPASSPRTCEIGN